VQHHQQRRRGDGGEEAAPAEVGAEEVRVPGGRQRHHLVEGDEGPTQRVDQADDRGELAATRCTDLDLFGVAAPAGRPTREHPSARRHPRERGPHRVVEERHRQQREDAEDHEVHPEQPRRIQVDGLGRRRIVDPVGVDVLATQEVDEEEHEGERRPGAEALGDASHRTGPLRADDHEGARHHDAALRERAEVQVVHVEGAPGSRGIGSEPHREGRRADQDQHDTRRERRARNRSRVRLFRCDDCRAHCVAPCGGVAACAVWAGTRPCPLRYRT